MQVRTMRRVVTAVVGSAGAVALLASGAPGAPGVPGLTGDAALTGSPTPAAGVRINSLRVEDGAFVESGQTLVASDGTFSFAFPTAAQYVLQLVGDGSYEATSVVVDSVPGATIECDVTVALAGSGDDSAFDCTQDVRSTVVYRFWSPGFDNSHFFTTDDNEAAYIYDNDPHWMYEGIAFRGVQASGGTCGAGSPVFRFYSPVFRSHFYTQSAAEKDHIVAHDRSWTYEGVPYCAYTEVVPGSLPLHRFWSPVFGKHFFTAHQAEADHIRANDPNWTYEGVAYQVLPHSEWPGDVDV